jgi:hypothetical protein
VFFPSSAQGFGPVNCGKVHRVFGAASFLADGWMIVISAKSSRLEMMTLDVWEGGEQRVLHCGSQKSQQCFLACFVGFTACGRQIYKNVPIKQFESSPPFMARVDSVTMVTNFDPAIVIIALKTKEGGRIVMGEPTEQPQLLEFALSLSEGKSYEFPKIWLDFRDTHRPVAGATK